ncbi:MAG: hypothetical protein LLG04_10250 [Parachlamydia sp.]|nr:hypothetical protein [Parachlamydia sp.]
MGAIHPRTEINGNLYAAYLKLANSPEKGSAYLSRNRKTGDYTVFFVPKNSPQMLPNYERLSFRTIVRLGYQLKKELLAHPEDACLVSKELQRMIAHQETNESKRNFLIRLVHKICDCARNLFGGFGLKTTATLAKRLSNELAQSASLPPGQKAVAEMARIAPAAASMPFTPSVASAAMPSPKPLVSYALQPRAHDKKTALTTYRKNPTSCTQQDKTTIWLEIGKFEPTLKEIVRKEIASVKMLMDHMSASKKADVADPRCAQVIVDSFRLCNKATTSDLALWLTREKCFSAPLLGQCLEALSNRAKEQTSTDSHALYLLLKHYKENKWNQFLPCAHPQVVTGIEALMLENHNDPNYIAMIQWMVDQKDFNIDAFMELTRIFVQKAGRNPATAHNTRFDALDQLLDWYNRNPSAKQELQTRNGSEDVASFLTARGY